MDFGYMDCKLYGLEQQRNYILEAVVSEHEGDIQEKFSELYAIMQDANDILDDILNYCKRENIELPKYYSHYFSLFT